MQALTCSFPDCQMGGDQKPLTLTKDILRIQDLCSAFAVWGLWPESLRVGHSVASRKQSVPMYVCNYVCIYVCLFAIMYDYTSLDSRCAYAFSIHFCIYINK